MGVVTILFGILMFRYAFSRYWKEQSIRRWSFRRMHYFFTYIAFGLGFLLLGTSNYVEQTRQIAFIIFGLGSILTAFIPCSLPVINKVAVLRVGKVLIFTAIGLLFLLYAQM